VNGTGPHNPKGGGRGPGVVAVDGARELAARALSRVLDDGAWGQPALSAILSASAMSPRDKALCTELFYGTLRFAGPLEASLLRGASKPGRGLDSRIRPHLLIAAYQLQHLSERIPAHAAVSAAVSAIKRERPGLEGFANALLRHLGSALHLMLTPQTSLAERCIAWGIPLELGQAIAAHVPPRDVDAALGGLKARPTTWALQLKAVAHDAATASVGDDADDGNDADDGGSVAHPFVEGMASMSGGRVDEATGYVDGAFIVMDPGSVMAARAAGAAPGQRVIDLCAAPGGKTVVLADAVGVGGHVDAIELQPRRASRITENLKRLGLSSRVTVQVKDALDVRADAADGAGAVGADVVVLDAPCTGLGTTRRKPEIALRFNGSDLSSTTALQRKLLDHAATLVRPGGTLVYSVCSPIPAEGHDVVSAFVAASGAFERIDLRQTFPHAPPSAFDSDGALRLLPHAHDADAFYVARLRRRP
jgi:16S rRNA (cytosine967-C5)-methyltransferase